MNAAARLVHRGVVSRHLVMTHSLTRSQIAIFVIMLGVLFSSLGIIYTTNLTRAIHAKYQKTLIEHSQIQTEYSQLLLERSAWMMQSRVQSIAKSKLDMTAPDYKSMVIIHE